MASPILLNIVFCGIFLFSIVIAGTCTGIAENKTSPRNDALFWTGISFFILCGFVLLNWIVFSCWVLGHDDQTTIIEWENCGGTKLTTVLFHMIFLELGLVCMIVGAGCLANDVYWLGIGFIIGWVIVWLLWLLFILYRRSML